MDLLKYYSKRCVNTVNHETLRKNLPTFTQKYCKVCGEVLKFQNSLGKTNTYCSSACASRDKDTWDKIKKTNMKRYGVEYSLSDKEIRKKGIETMIKKYGEVVSLGSKRGREKVKRTMMKRYGVDNPMKSEVIRKRAEKTNMKRYGFSSPMKNEDVKSEHIKSIMDMYGCEYVGQIPSGKEKAIKTSLKKYGCKYPIQSDVVKNKIKETNIDRYGFPYASSSDEVKEKIKQTNLKRYGVEYSGSIPSAIEKRVKTNKKKNGGVHFFQTKKFIKKNRERIIDEYIEKNGNYLGGKLTTDYVDYFYECPECKTVSVFPTQKGYSVLSQRIMSGNTACDKCMKSSLKGIYTRSNIEMYLEDVLNKEGIKTSHRKRIDIILDDYNIGIEVNGLYWHSEFHKDKNYHVKKMQLIKDNGLNGLAFSDLQIENDLDKVVRYIKGKCGLLPSVGASKCKIRDITHKEAKAFCDEYHIHGYAIGSKNYGLFYKGELVSVCIVGKERFVKKSDNIEIVRLCNKFKVIGGMGRFLKKILNDFNGKSISTYIDAFLGERDNNVFTRHGFMFSHHTPPGYVWTNGRDIISRYKVQMKGEVKYMHDKGYYRYYNAGNYKYVLTPHNK